MAGAGFSEAPDSLGPDCPKGGWTVKILIEIADGLDEDELIIRCSKMTEQIENIQKYASRQSADAPRIVFFKDTTEYYFPLDEVLFFETSGDSVYAHTPNDNYRIKLRLYELDDMLPGQFVRGSKSAIINTGRINSINKNLASSSLVEFRGSNKHVYVSRRYYSLLRQRLEERSQQ